MWTLNALISCSLIAAVTARALVVDLQTLNFEYNRDTIRNMSVSLVMLNNRRVINGSIILDRDLPTFHLSISVKIPNFSKNYFNLTLNGCDFIEQSFVKDLQLSKFVAKNIRNSLLNVPKRCPVKKSTEVVISKLYIDTEVLPAYIPQTRFECTVMASALSSMAFKIMVTGVVKPKPKRSG